MPTTLPISEHEPPEPVAETRAANGPAAATPNRSARQMVETMRLGVVPSAGPSGYTVGREVALELADDDLDRAAAGTGAVRAFLGDYGAGKTHMLELVRHRALERGFVVCRAVLDARETPPSHPGRVYRALISSMRYPDVGVAGLRPLLERAATDGGVLEAFGADVTGELDLDEGMHLYLTPALRYASVLLDPTADAERHAYGASILVDWLSAEPTTFTGDIDAELAACAGGRRGRIYCLMDFRPWARIYGYILSGIATLARALGYEGLVLLVDEAEFFALLSSQNREYARFLFKALAYAAVGEAGGLPFEASELDLGGYGVQQELPPQYGDAPGLYTVFAMTPNEAGVDALSEAVPTSAWHELEGLTRDDFRELVRRVLDIYRAAHADMALPDGLVDPLTKVVAGLVDTGVIRNPREAMKFLVQFFDVARHRPGDMQQVFRGLRDDLMLF